MCWWGGDFSPSIWRWAVGLAGTGLSCSARQILPACLPSPSGQALSIIGWLPAIGDKAGTKVTQTNFPPAHFHVDLIIQNYAVRSLLACRVMRTRTGCLCQPLVGTVAGEGLCALGVGTAMLRAQSRGKVYVDRSERWKGAAMWNQARVKGRRCSGSISRFSLIRPEQAVRLETDGPQAFTPGSEPSPFAVRNGSKRGGRMGGKPSRALGTEQGR